MIIIINNLSIIINFFIIDFMNGWKFNFVILISYNLNEINIYII